MDFNVALSIYHNFVVFGHGLVRVSDIYIFIYIYIFFFFLCKEF